MEHKFNITLMDAQWDYMTYTVNGVKNIVINDDDDLFTYERILSIVDKAKSTERLQYGWLDRYVENGQHKQLFIRGSVHGTLNLTTRSKESIYGWIDKLFGVNQQMNLWQ